MTGHVLDRPVWHSLIGVHAHLSRRHGIAAAYDMSLWGMPRLPETIVRAAAEMSEAYGRIFDQAMMFNRDKLNELFMQHFVLDGRRIRDELGFAPQTSFADGARTTAAWYRANRWD